MKNKIRLFVFIFQICILLEGFSGSAHYLVYLKDKPAASIEVLKKQYAAKALEKRTLRNIPFNEADFPINSLYIQQISGKAKVSQTLKWINAVHIESDEKNIQSIISLPFVLKVETLFNPSKSKKTNAQKFNYSFEPAAYGSGKNQIEMLNGHQLHDSNYIGKDIDIAVFDNGFLKVDSIRFFSKAFAEGRIKGVRDFVNNNTSVYTAGSHGTNVLSCMASFKMDTFIGAAPGTNYYLFITEDNNSETKLEEVNWAKAAEMCDSMGIDIINSSLGYTVFDDKTTNYTYADMNGRTTIISRAAEIASAKGILVVNSAGNEGDDAWRYISAPADAPTVLAIGAVTGTGIITGFSGRGPSADGRIKPDVVAKGAGTTVISVDGKVSTSNGTSFSSPIIAGMAACLWQAIPSATNLDVREAIIQSTDKLKFPDMAYGYGQPDFKRALAILKEKDKKILNGFSLFPNPFKNFINITNDYSEYKTYEVEVMDERGNLVKHKTVDLVPIQLGYFALPLSDLAAGNYFIKITSGGKSNIWRIIKEN